MYSRSRGAPEGTPLEEATILRCTDAGLATFGTRDESTSANPPVSKPVLRHVAVVASITAHQARAALLVKFVSMRRRGSLRGLPAVRRVQLTSRACPSSSEIAPVQSHSPCRQVYLRSEKEVSKGAQGSWVVMANDSLVPLDSSLQRERSTDRRRHRLLAHRAPVLGRRSLNLRQTSFACDVLLCTEHHGRVRDAEADFAE